MDSLGSITDTVRKVLTCDRAITAVVVRHARYVTFQMAEVAVPKALTVCSFAPWLPGQGGLRLVLAQAQYRGPPLSESLRVPRVPYLIPSLRSNMITLQWQARVGESAARLG